MNYGLLSSTGCFMNYGLLSSAGCFNNHGQLSSIPLILQMLTPSSGMHMIEISKGYARCNIDNPKL